MDVKEFGLRHWLTITIAASVVMLMWWASRPSALPADAAAPEEFPGLTRSEPETLEPMAAGPISGNWIGYTEVGNARTEYRFSLQEADGSLTGTARLPTGAGVIQAGSLLNGNVTLVTLSEASAKGQQQQTQFVGTHAGDRLYLVMKDESGDVNLTLQRAP